MYHYQPSLRLPLNRREIPTSFDDINQYLTVLPIIRIERLIASIHVSSLAGLFFSLFCCPLKDEL